MIRGIGLFCAVALSVGVMVYGSQPRKAGENRTRPTESSVATPVAAIPARLSYSGPGEVFVTSTGILGFGRGEVPAPPYVGFDLNFDEETIRAIEEGEIEPVEVTGLLDLSYDVNAGALRVRATVSDQVVHEETYRLNSDGQRPADVFQGLVEGFFAYMRNGGTFQPHVDSDETGRGSSLSCSCHAPRNPPRCECSVVCEQLMDVQGAIAFCDCRRTNVCRCGCLYLLE